LIPKFPEPAIEAFMTTDPAARRAIIFEDHNGLASALTDLLERRLGYDVVACAGCIEDALRVAHVERCDVAVVDLDLQGIMAYPALDELIRRGIPYVLATGAMPLDIPVRYLAPLVCKPYSAQQLELAIREACARMAVRANASAVGTVSAGGRAG
jgi:DNA-binding NarL/FixJ family response regulator